MQLFGGEHSVLLQSNHACFCEIFTGIPTPVLRRLKIAIRQLRVTCGRLQERGVGQPWPLPANCSSDAKRANGTRTCLTLDQPDEASLAQYLREPDPPLTPTRAVTMTSEARTLEALLRNDFRAFVHKVFATLTPGQTYFRTWHVEAIAWRLERVRRGEVRQLIINMPPRSLKSIAASVAFPAFVLGRDPSRRIICVSYSADLAKKHSNDFRAVIESPWYRSAFPNTRIGPFKNSETEIELTMRGFRLATSVGGTLTGRGGDIIVIDDPLKPDDALSETKQTAANQWFTNTLLSRLDDKRTGAIVVVMQRVHIDDLTGFLLSQSEEWDVLYTLFTSQRENPSDL
jgi:hypothetical protein